MIRSSEGCRLRAFKKRPRVREGWTGDARQTPAQVRLRMFRGHLAMWTLQAWLAMVFIGAAYAKLTQPPELLEIMLGWPKAVDMRFVWAVGAIELGLGLGLLAPALSWRLFGPLMTVAALSAAGAGAGMAIVHIVRHEAGFAALNIAITTAAITVVVVRRRLSCSTLPKSDGD